MSQLLFFNALAVGLSGRRLRFQKGSPQGAVSFLGEIHMSESKI
jgi:hypothetical protein